MGPGQREGEVMECENPECSRCNPTEKAWCAACLEFYTQKQDLVSGLFPLTKERPKVYYEICRVEGGQNAYSHRVLK